MTDYSQSVFEYVTANEQLPVVYTFNYNNLTFIGLNSVFSPIIFEDTFFFYENLPICANDEFLEIGCGTGFISVNFAIKGANVTATDINHNAIKNTKLNSILHNTENKLKIQYSNVFENISNSAKFDAIFWNVPFIFHVNKELSTLEQSIFDIEYNGIRKYISNIKFYLKSNGKAFLGFSSSSGNKELLESICRQNDFCLKLIAQTFLKDDKNEDDFSLELYELKSNF